MKSLSYPFSCTLVRHGQYSQPMNNVWRLSTWSANIKCPKICWQDHIRNSEVAARTGLGPVSDLIKCRRNSLFGHIARLSEDTPAHQALRSHVDLTLSHPSEHSWKRRPGHPNNRWIDQLCRDNNDTPPALTCGKDSPCVVIRSLREWRYGPRRLRIDDDTKISPGSSLPVDEGVPWRQPHCRSGMANLPSVEGHPLVTPY